MSMNQGKLDMVKQEMAKVSLGILGISELKWMTMGDFNLDEYYIYYCGKESLRNWCSPHSQQKTLKCSTRTQSQN